MYIYHTLTDTPSAGNVMNRIQVVFIVQTMLGFIGMAVWYMVGKMRGRRNTWRPTTPP